MFRVQLDHLALFWSSNHRMLSFGSKQMRFLNCHVVVLVLILFIAFVLYFCLASFQWIPFTRVSDSTKLITHPRTSIQNTNVSNDNASNEYDQFVIKLRSKFRLHQQGYHLSVVRNPDQYSDDFRQLVSKISKLSKAVKTSICSLSCPVYNITDNYRLISLDSIFSFKNDLNCAIVSNSASLTNSNLGTEINNHDLVLRFNNAPVIGFENDVGNKTNLRVVNSKLVLNDKYNLSTDPLYQNVFNFAYNCSEFFDENFQTWKIKNNEFFTKLAEKSFHINSLLLLDQSFVWDSWKLLQGYSRKYIAPNPPTSGFLGIVLMLKVCSKVNIYEYIPSHRINDRCHYYDTELNRGCTFGEWHPLSTEKLFMLDINEGNNRDIYTKGKLTIDGCAGTDDSN